MYGVLSSVLHLGNVGIVLKSRRGDEAKIPDDDQHLPVVAALLGVVCVVLWWEQYIFLF
jgi:hypothetical protein